MSRTAIKRVLIVALVSVLAMGWSAVFPRQADAAWTNATIGNYQYWYWDGAQKFRYDTVNGRWWHFSTFGSWQTLSNGGHPATFIGNGAWHDLGYGLTYRYVVANDYGYFQDGGVYRFYYRYGTGQWYHTGNALSWQLLGGAGRSAAVLGNGLWYDLGYGLTYRYLAASDYGYFQDGGVYRFYYRYGPGQWYHTGNALSWQLLGGAGRNAGVLGNGLWYDLGNGLVYRYLAASDYGYFKDGGVYRFYYRYVPGQWYLTGNTLSWQLLGVAGHNAAVLGNGVWYDLGNGFTYRYVAANDWGYFLDGGIYRFYYRYGPGQWYHTGNTLSWQVLGAAGRTAVFVGTTTWTNLGNGFWYSYIRQIDLGHWSTNSTGSGDRFGYAYNTGTWGHRGFGGGFYNLTPGGRSASFIGDGAVHDLGNDFFYRYSKATDTAIWNFLNEATGDRFKYWYATGLWEHKGTIGGFNPLGHAGMNGSFLGDGNQHNLNNGYAYLFFADVAFWYIGGLQSIKYDYGMRQWLQWNVALQLWVLLAANAGTEKYNPGEP